jgi:hypothetical protein
MKLDVQKYDGNALLSFISMGGDEQMTFVFLFHNTTKESI